MANLNQLLDQAARHDDDTQALVRQLVDHYEHELSQMTTHLGQTYEELALLYDVSEEVASTLDTDTVADRAVERIRDLLEVPYSAIMLTAEDAADPAHGRSVGSEPLAPAMLTLIDWATRRAIDRDRSQILNDLPGSGAPSAPGAACLLSCPLRARGRVVGVAHVWHHDPADEFTTEDERLLQAIAHQIGVAVDNSRLFATEQQHARSLASALDELEDTYDATLAALSGALDLRDNETEGHARRVTHYSVRIAQELGIDGQDLLDLERGALLHDIGKIGVPDAILLKPARLTEEEWAIMRTHPVLGHQIVSQIRFLEPAIPIVLHHHERFDGDGYPHRLAGADIPLGARVFAVADTFDAMTSDRPYRRALSAALAREEIARCSGTQFDPEVVAAFARVDPAEWATIRERVQRVLHSRKQAEPEPAELLAMR